MQEGIYTATEYREPALEPGMAYQGPIETLIGSFSDERDAIEAARRQWKDFRHVRLPRCRLVDRPQARRRTCSLDRRKPELGRTCAGSENK